MLNGFNSSDATFINWELVKNDKTNIALKDGEHHNLDAAIAEAKDKGIHFILIIDEEHRNQTNKAQKVIDRFDAKLEPLSSFVIPGEKQSSAYLHVARTITRRAERALWRVLDAGESVHESNLKYLNRLSDLCFILCRVEEELGAE